MAKTLVNSSRQLSLTAFVLVSAYAAFTFG